MKGLQEISSTTRMCPRALQGKKLQGAPNCFFNLTPF